MPRHGRYAGGNLQGMASIVCPLHGIHRDRQANVKLELIHLEINKACCAGGFRLGGLEHCRLDTKVLIVHCCAAPLEKSIARPVIR